MKPHVAAVLALVLTGCRLGSTSECAHVNLSLASDRGGEATPVAAAERFTGSGTGRFPRSGWTVTDHDANGVRLTSGRASLHAVQGSDATWQVDSGTTC